MSRGAKFVSIYVIEFVLIQFLQGICMILSSSLQAICMLPLPLSHYYRMLILPIRVSMVVTKVQLNLSALCWHETYFWGAIFARQVAAGFHHVRAAPQRNRFEQWNSEEKNPTTLDDEILEMNWWDFQKLPLYCTNFLRVLKDKLRSPIVSWKSSLQVPTLSEFIRLSYPKEGKGVLTSFLTGFAILSFFLRFLNITLA